MKTLNDYVKEVVDDSDLIKRTAAMRYIQKK